MKLNRRLKSIVKAIVDSVHPEKIILFGSRARKDYRKDSDYDLMIVQRNVKNERAISRKIQQVLYEKNISGDIDLIVVGRKKIETHKDNPYLIYSWALREGRLLYG